MTFRLDVSDDGSVALLQIDEEHLVVHWPIDKGDAAVLIGQLAMFLGGKPAQLALPQGGEEKRVALALSGKGYQAALRYGPPGWADQFAVEVTDLGSRGSSASFGLVTEGEAQIILKALTATTHVGQAIIGRPAYTNAQNCKATVRRLLAENFGR